ncbi:MAG: GAF domain-containing protein [Myxococcales bacterium]|nr:GAF domain-containing protein [Myxococcales bacterium]MCB9520035.1 GAF domain-containing protein [Myxococcales bacterium]
MPRVEYIDPSGVTREVTFKRQLRIGRHPNQDLQILDRVVSKAHAVIEVRGDGAVVYDAGSRNGTIVNGELIEGERTLEDGDRVTLGSTDVVFRAEESQKEALRSKVTILEEGFEASVRKRLKDTSNRLFVSVDQIDDMEQLRDDYEKLRIANELNQALSAEFDLERLLNRILDKAFEMFGADRGVIMLIDPDGGELVPAAMKSKFDNVGAGAIRISRTIIREVVDEKSAVLSSNAQLDSRFGGAHSIILAGIKATMSVPLLYRETLLGIIHLDSQMTTGAFTEKDLQLLTGFANQAANAIEHSRLVEQVKNDALAREQLGRLLSPEVVDDVVSGKLEIKRGGTVRDATVLFADIRGFTAMSERYPAQEIVAMLNEYFEIMVEIIFRHGGTLDKFVGDEIMAVWGAPIAVEDHCARAVAAALDMQIAMVEYNQTRLGEGLPAIHAGIGINTGELVAGFMGSSKAMDFTVIGDTVNTASRFCACASGGDVIVGPAVARSLGRRLVAEAMEPARLKGKAEPVPVFRVKAIR